MNVFQKIGGNLHTPDIIEGGKKRFPLNVFTNFVYLAISVVFNFWFTPYLLRNLGSSVYGLIPLANSVIAYMSVFTLSINSATGRFLTIDLVKHDDENANRTFNTSFLGNLFFAGLIFPCVLVGAYFIPDIFNVPLGYENSAKWLFFLVGLAFLSNALGSVFAVSTYSHNRFDLRNSEQIIWLLVRTSLIIVAFTVFQPQVWIMGVSTLLASCVSFLIYVCLWRRLTPQLRIDFKLFNWKHFQELFGMGGWVLLNQFGALLISNIDLICVNRFFGAEMGGKYGAVLPFLVLLRAAGNSVSSVLSPMMNARYAQGNTDALTKMANKFMKLMGTAVSLPVGLLCGFAFPLLTLWLGPSFADMSIVVVILSVSLSVTLSVMGLFPLQMSANQVRWPAIVTFLFGILNFFLATGMAKSRLLGVAGVAVASAFVVVLKNVVFTPVYTARIFRLPWWKFLPELMRTVLITTGVAGISYLATQIYMPVNWPVLVLECALVTVSYGLITSLFILDANDRQFILRQVPGFLK